MSMIKEKFKNYHSYKTLLIPKTRNEKLAFLTETIRLVKPAIEDIKNGDVMTMEEFGAWLDELYATYE